MIISTDEVKALDKIQLPFIIKTVSKLRNVRNSFNVIKGIYKEHHI